MSRPVRARGLKHNEALFSDHARSVAPRAGAWIETGSHSLSFLLVQSRPVRARGLKRRVALQDQVRAKSRPVRARGLKQCAAILLLRADPVAPRAGAWIETIAGPGR